MPALSSSSLSVLDVLSLLSEMGDWKLVAYELSARHDGRKYDDRG